MKKDKRFCVGCDDNFYNGNNPMGIKGCWSFKTARVVMKYQIGWWTPQDKKDNFKKVTTHSCYTRRGSFAFYDKLPQHLEHLVA